MNLNATIIGQTISFIFFVLFCMKYIWPPIIKLIQDRESEINNSFNLIKKKEMDLKIQMNEVNNIKEKAKKEAELIIYNAHLDKNQIIEQAKIKATTESKKILLNAQLKIKNENNQMYEELKNKATFLSIIIAEKILKRTINEKDHQNFINQILSHF